MPSKKFAAVSPGRPDSQGQALNASSRANGELAGSLSKLTTCPICGQNFMKRRKDQNYDSAVCRFAGWQINRAKELLRDSFTAAYYEMKFRIIKEAKKKRSKT